MNEHPKDRASATPSSFDTSLSYVLSHLLPTSMKIGFCLFTRSIDCRKTSSLSNVDRDAIEYTRINPCPSLWKKMSTDHPHQKVRIRTGPIDPAELHIPLFGGRSKQYRQDMRLELTLTSSIDDFYKTHFIIHNQLFSIRILYGRIISLDMY